jgi:Adenosine deaminase/Helix-turn-helix domain
VRRKLSTIDEQLQRLNGLVGKLLEVSRISAAVCSSIAGAGISPDSPPTASSGSTSRERRGSSACCCTRRGRMLAEGDPVARELLAANRIDHGVRAIEDEAVMALLAERRIPLGVCPTSNVALGVYPAVMRYTGGMRPKAWNRSARHVSLSEREDILRGLLAGHSFREIAAELGRAPSRSRAKSPGTVAVGLPRISSRRRCGTPCPSSEAVQAHPQRTTSHEVERRLEERWSPQQIAARLVHDYPDDSEMRVSHETIYRSLFVQARCALSSRHVSAPAAPSGGRTSGPSTRELFPRLLEIVSSDAAASQ